MSGPGVILRELHRLRRFAKDLQTKIDQGPRALQTQQARAARQEDAVHQAQEGLKKLKVAMHEKDVTLKTTLQQITKYQKQQNEAASKKEYDALQHEIDGARKKVSKLEDEILEAMGESEEHAAKLPEVEKAAKHVKAEVARFATEHAARLADYAEQLRQTEQQIKEVEGTLPDDVRPQYQRLITAKGDDALSALSGRTCSACYTEITAQSHNNLSMGNFVICKHCGRILYLPE
jgi:predicted  nucleic acid-binding Zn-ribbon protein